MIAPAASPSGAGSNRLDVPDLAIVVSVAVDSEDRVDNLRLLLDYLDAVCRDAAVMVVEQAVEPVLASLCDRPGVRHHAIRDGGAHWKTRNLNRGAILSMREFVLFMDCDLAIAPQALAQGLARLREGASFVQPFDGVAVNVDRRILRSRADWMSILAEAPHFDRWHRPGSFPVELALFSPLYGDADYLATGGCIACRREDHIVAGGWNENIVSYGFEDREYFERLAKLGWHVERVTGHNAYHLDHARGRDSHYNDYHELNEAEYRRIAGFGRDELESYVINGFRRPAFRAGTRYRRIETDTESRLFAIPEDRDDLHGRKVSVLVDAATTSAEASDLYRILDDLEKRYRNYQVQVTESGGRRYADLVNRANVIYRFVPTSAEVTGVNGNDPVCLTDDAGENMQRILDVLGRVGQRQGSSSRIVTGDDPMPSLPPPGSRRTPATRDWQPSRHAIYLCFDDDYADFARACINSLSCNFPDHPTLLVDYTGCDDGVFQWLSSVGAVRLASGEPSEFARRIGNGPVGRDIVFRRFRLWDAAFDDYEVILHLDADTLILGELTELFEGDSFKIVPNHEPTGHVRVFDPIFDLDPVLNDRLEEDGIAFPDSSTDLANAGVFSIPRRLRSAVEREALRYLAERFGEYFAYADQSLISLWCRYRGLPFQDDVRYNYQSPFLTDARISVDLSTVRVFHFSSPRKPGSPAFRQWQRLGAHAPMLEEAFDYYVSLR